MEVGWSAWLPSKKEMPGRKLYNTQSVSPVEGGCFSLQPLYLVLMAGDPSLKADKSGHYRVMSLGI